MKISRQRAYQLRRIEEGLCSICGTGKLVSSAKCRKCLTDDRLRSRERTGSKPWQEGRPGRPPNKV